MSVRQLLTCDGCGKEIEAGTEHKFLGYSVKLEDSEGPRGSRLDGVKLEIGPDFCIPQCFLRKLIKESNAELEKWGAQPQ